MKKSLLSTLLDGKAFREELNEFQSRAEPNPFGPKKKKVVVVDISDLEDEVRGMDDFVRGDGDPRGLDKVSRSHTGPDSGVNASRYDDMVRDIDNPDREKVPGDAQSSDDRARIDPDALYLTTRDRSYKRNEWDREDDVLDIEHDPEEVFMRGLEDDDEDIDDEFSDLDPEADDEESRYEGIVRAVKGAYLVSKKQQPNETYTEIWMYNVGEKYDDEANVRRSILAATDIDPTKGFSEDGSQTADMRTVGNVQFLTLAGLQN